MTPREANPAYKVYEVDPDTYEVMDAHTYVGDISEAGWQTKRKMVNPLLHKLR